MSRFLSGQWNAVCDRCGLEFKSGELRLDWQGLMVDDKCYETRHPQDLLRVKPERTLPSWARPEGEDVFLSVACTLQGMQGIAGIGTAGCLRTSFTSPY